MSRRRRNAPPASRKGEAPPAPNNGGAGRGKPSGSPIIGGGGGSLPGNTAHRLLLVVLVASLALSMLFALRLPLDANPDERDHLNYVRLLAEGRGLVRFVAGDPERYQTHQPPAYYLLAALVHAATGGSVVAIRLINAVFQLLTVAVAFRAGRSVFPERPEIAVGAAAFVAFLPTQAQLSGAITNDPLTTLICAAIFWRLAGVAGAASDRRNAIIIGVLLGFGLLTKLSVLQLVPAILLAYGIAVASRTLTLRDAATQAALVFGLAVLIASPWLVRNTRLYGDPLTLGIYLLTGPNFTPQQIMPIAGWSTLGEYLSNAATRTYVTFWYLLPPNVIHPNRFAQVPLLLVVLLGLGGLLGTLRWLGRGEGEPAQRRVMALYVAGIFLLMPFFLRFILATFQAQGRYFLPALLPAALVACLGWGALASRARLAGALVAGAVLLALTLYALGGGTFAG